MFLFGKCYLFVAIIYNRKMSKQKIIRTCTVPQSLGFVAGMLSDLQKKYEVVLLSSPGPECERILVPSRYKVYRSEYGTPYFTD